MPDIPLRQDDGSTVPEEVWEGERYPLSLRFLHWTRALLVLGMLGAGWLMTSLGDAVPLKYGTLYPLHKSVGLLIFGLVVIQIAIRLRTTLPPSPHAIAPWEGRLSKLVHTAMYILLISVPLMGYAMSSSYTHGDGIAFFGFPVAELLPKDDANFALFQWIHKVSAYVLLALIGLHLTAVVKHRFFDKRTGSDVLPRML